MIKKATLIMGILIAVIFFILGVVASYLINKPTSEIKKDANTTQTEQKVEQYPEVLVRMSKTWSVYVGTKSININPFEGQNARLSMYISKEDYPKLFGPFDNFYYTTIDEIDDKVHKKKFLFINSNINSHGFYSPIYGIIADPETESVVYEASKVFQGSIDLYKFLEGDSVIKFDFDPYSFNNSCNTCRLRVLEYISYDPGSMKFVSVNNKYTSDFKELLSTYEKEAKNCHYDGKVRTVDEVIQIAGENARCDDMLFPADVSKKGANYLMSVGEFKSIMEKIKKIISGQNESFVE